MPSNRALVVDDSRSARHILSRMLESFGLEVDAVESAELALTYLRNTRPDVIFMDHLMPGMDGFAAVRVIKANPDTATIPVLMYTSQEGEMYLSQARALGAMGVLPKTLKHADVAEALQHLNLATNGMVTQPVKPRAAVQIPEPVAATPAAVSVVEPLPAAALMAEQAVASMSTSQLAHRIAAEVNAEMVRTSTPQVSQRWRSATLLASIAALLLLCAVIYQQNQLRQQLSQLQTAQQRLTTRLAADPAAPTPAVAAPAAVPTLLPASSVPAARIETEAVPYGEVPLSGPRLEKLRELVEGMRSEQVKGTVRVESFMGDFCLSGTPATGYMPAEDKVLVIHCDVVGNPFGDALTVQQRQTVAFANLVASINSSASGGIKVQVVDGGHKAAAAYPAPSATLTAAAWNMVAERNQRVEFTVPTSP